MKREHFLNLLLVAIVAAAGFVVSVIQTNYKAQSNENTRVRVKAEVAEKIAVETVEAFAVTEAENVSLRTALAMEEEQRKQTQALVEFMRNHETFVVICADPQGRIFRVNGTPSVVNWSAQSLRQSSVSDLILRKHGTGHADAMQERADEGKTGKVFRFYDKPARTESGGVVRVDGLVLWFHDKSEFMGIFAPPVK